MTEAFIVVLLQKIAIILGASALKVIGKKFGKEATILLDVENSMKEIESEFDIMQAFINQVDPCSANNQLFQSWLKHIRKIAFDVEDIIDEYAFLLGKMDGSESSMWKVLHMSKNIRTWYNVASDLQRVKARLQSLTIMKERYGINITDHRENRSRKNTSSCIHLSGTSYLNDDESMVGHESQAQRLADCLNDGCMERIVISIWGMGGVGKTTLANSTCNKKDVRMNFDCCTFISVSQNYKVEDLLRKIIKQLGLKTKVTITTDAKDMVEQIHNFLAKKRYLIILDDMWDKDSWSFIDFAFARNVLGSRIIITTRIEGVASLAHLNYTVRLGSLSQDESWKLFGKKAFSKLSDATCPESLVPWAKKILEKCCGLPLAIVAIGSLLSYRDMDEQEWRSFYIQLHWQLIHNPELRWVSNVLNLSLIDLPAHLKNCFLYCSLFPEDYRIRRKWVIRLWIAEGLVENRGAGTTPEDVAEDYLKELTQRSLIQVVQRNKYGRPKMFVVHDLVREITLGIARTERFASICDHPDVMNAGDAARRLSVHSGGQIIKPSLASKQLRSFLLFDRHASIQWICTVSLSFRLIRVLCLRYSVLEVVPDAVAGLFNLYYLDMSRSKVKKIPKSVAKLKNLQTLHFRFSRVSRLPCEVTTLTSLRHLSVSNDLFGISVPGSIRDLRYLQTLREVKASKDLVQQIRHLTQLRSLAITEILTSHNTDLWASIHKMSILSRLAVVTQDDNEVIHFEKLRSHRNLEKLYLTGKLAEGNISSLSCGFQKLKVLWMRRSRILQDPLRTLSQMPSLVNLNLHCAYEGSSLLFCSGWFPMLTNLCLRKLDNLNSIQIEDGTLRNLAYLELRELWNITTVPEGLAYLRSLRRLHAQNMPADFVEMLEGDGRSFIQHVTSIECV